jgi:hypothetical protein
VLRRRDRQSVGELAAEVHAADREMADAGRRGDLGCGETSTSPGTSTFFRTPRRRRRVGRLDTAGLITHGHLGENAGHGGGTATLPDARSLLSRRAQGAVAITGFLSSRGDLNRGGTLPAIRRGDALAREFVGETAPATQESASAASAVGVPDDRPADGSFQILGARLAGAASCSS